MMVMVKVMTTKEMIKCFIFEKEEREKQKWA
jgi:riboflavin synthase